MCSISAAITAVAAIAGGVAEKQQQTFNARVLDQQAELLRRRAENTALRGDIERERLMFRSGTARAKGRVGFAAGGVTLGVGSPVAFEQNLARVTARDVNISGLNTSNAESADLASANSANASADAARQAGQFAMLGGLLDATATAADAFSETFPKKHKTK